jgi:elongation factor 3
LRRYSLCSCVKNAEVLGMLDLVIDALRHPEKKTEDCLDKLMETTFVNSMDAPSLAVVGRCSFKPAKT